ncbi:MAG: hypothetical protein JSV03_15990 [Planctomycetota bacterium]|nr:MAG: hypothetical protein JSV03_15990 [Planctomycetota bacterium]
MFQTNMWCYLWDLVDEGIDKVLDRLQGEAGITGISVATFYHSVDQLRPHAGVLPKRFLSPGGAQFQPQADRYTGTRIKPAAASWLKKSNPLAKVAEACEKRKLALRGWTVCCHSSLMVSKYSNGAVKNVFGDIDPTWLCPINPDVREYLRAMVEDLSGNYPFETIELERPTFQERPHSHAHYKVGIELGEVGHWLSDLCFCESCRQAAVDDGIDAGAAAKAAGAALEKIFAGGDPLEQSIEEFMGDVPVLSDYVDWRCAKVASLVETIKQSCKCRIVVHRAGGRFVAAADFKTIGPYCDATLSNCPHPYTDQTIDETVNEALKDTGEISHVELGFNAFSPFCPDSATLVRSVSHVAKLGVPSVNIYNYGLIPLSRMEWIRRATRYAGREAD